MRMVIDAAGCNKYDVDSGEAIGCLRSLDTKSLAEKSFETYGAAKATGEGDCWFPVVDGNFLPDAPSRMIAEGRFAKIATMIMWASVDPQASAPQETVGLTCR